MHDGPTEIYHPRGFSDLGIWNTGTVQFKVYGLFAKGKDVSAAMMSAAQHVIEDQVLERVTTMGDSNDLGFVIIHPGDLGLSISAHWWVQGSVLCQHIHRQIYEAPEPMNTADRPVVACVWELALINAEQDAWRQHMMVETPDRAAYLAARPTLDAT